MDENRGQAYLNLIQQLLTCPNGEEPEILQANSELVDLEFLQVCEGVAAQLAESGNENAADFLRNIASQLGEFWGFTSAAGNEVDNKSPDDYLTFLQLLLQTEDENFGGDARHIYAVLQANLDKLNLNFIPVLQQRMAEILWVIDDREEVEVIATLIENIANKIQEFPKGRRADNLEIAIAAYEIVLLVFTRETNPEDWAQTQGNLAVAYDNRIKGEKADNLEMAIVCYTNALEVYTREAFPQKWAMTQNNLAVAYSNRIRGKRADNIERAISFYTAALEVRTREAFPEKWADTQNNLAVAYSNRIRGKRADNIERAISFYTAALEVRTREAFPEKWADTQNNLATAYYNRIRGERADNLEMVIALYTAALEVYTREAFPQKWAMTQNNLAIAYSTRIRGESADNIERAISFYTAALEVRTRKDFPLDWADTQNNLAVAYRDRIRGKRADNIERAISFYTAALEVRTREAFPLDWADTQNNLAIAYHDRIKEERADNIERAIAFYTAALEVRTREDFPEDWAQTKHNLAIAYRDRIRGERADNIERAIAFYTAALEVRTREAFPEKWAMTQNNLGNAYSNRIRGKRADNIQQAIAFYRNALEIRTCEDFAQDHAETLFNLGLTYREVPNLQSAYDSFADAINTVELLRGEIHSGDETKRKLAEKYNQIYRNMVEVCLEIKNYTAAIEYVERSKARNLVELLANKDIYPEREVYPNSELYQSHCQQLEQLRREIPGKQRELEIFGSSREREEENHDRIKVVRSQINHLQENLNELLAKINQIDKRFAFTQEVKKIPFSDIQSLTDENTAIVEWYITGSQIFTLIITRHHPHPIVVASEQMTALENWDNEYRDSYQNQKTQWIKNLASRLQNLAEILHIDEIISRIDECFFEIGTKCDRLILIPHRYLHLFPLHALPLADGKLLFERFPKGVGYAPSCQLLKQAKDQEQHRPDFTRLFAIQNPVRKDPGPLLGSQLEVNKISQHFDSEQSIILKEVEATEANLYQSMEQIRSSHCLHFSCHGKFNSESPLKSALLLTDPENKLGEEGKLTLGEVFEKLYLNQCRLVTFSACESGMTDPHSISDEYIGLPSGFLYAGSPSIVSTLWSVEPIATTLLMVKFYHNLKQLPQITTGDVAIALNKAQKWLRTLTYKKWARIQSYPQFEHLVEEAFENSPKRDLNRFKESLSASLHPNRQPLPFANPYYWSAFVAIGI
ncbi:CHAT domain-containing protein [Limnoraphis robusta]|uniref:CHAT domain-containing protein n=1 Tax=Limnoraphis robusta TaxID=1118279 RepID=UPI002B2217D2|nr:CHAT domain-containing protein [Limnoraphis robusta]MEA5500916.1 CHAT domain-containing protein [Limnoraphis robusta BA-68 BA1]